MPEVFGTAAKWGFALTEHCGKQARSNHPE